MSRLEDLLRETLTAREAGAPDATRLVADVRRRIRRRRVQWAGAGFSAAAVTALAVTLAVVLPGQDTQSVLPQPSSTVGTQTYPLPSDGWKPGDPSLSALTTGPFHAARRDGQVCAWLGDSFRPML